MKEDHRSYYYKRNFCSFEKKALNKIQACTGFEPLTIAEVKGSNPVRV